VTVTPTGGTGGPPVVLWADVEDVKEPGALVLKDKNSGRSKSDSTNTDTDTPTLDVCVARDGNGDVEFWLIVDAGTFDWVIKQGTTTVASGTLVSPSYKAEKLDLDPGEYTLEVTKPADPDFKRRIDFIVVSVEIVSLSPTGDLVLGEDLTVEYKVNGSSSFSFDSVELHVYNYSDVLIYKRTGLGATAGTHNTTWEDAKWNQSPHSGAYANPNNGPYKVEIVATCSCSSPHSTSDSRTINTVLILEFDLEDDKPASDEISSGIFADAVDATKTDRIAVGLTPVSGGTHIFGTSAPVFSAKTMVDLDNDPAVTEIKDTHVKQVMQSSISDGSYYVVVKRVRDKAGNAGVDGYTASGGVTTINDWQIRMY
jgi:hypothetical protein